MARTMADRKQTIRLLYFCAAILVLLFIVGVYVVNIVFSAKWEEKEELFGLKHGMTKQVVIKKLIGLGVSDVLPRTEVELVLTKKNVAFSNRLDHSKVRGVCVVSYAEGISEKISFNAIGDVTGVSATKKRFTELSNLKTRRELISLLPVMMEHHDGLEAFACIPDARWLRISSTNISDSKEILTYNVWLFDEPNSYSGVKLRFEGERLSRIEYRKQSSELP